MFPEEEILGLLDDAIKAGEVVVLRQEAEGFWDLLGERFPTAADQIYWLDVPNHSALHPEYLPGEGTNSPGFKERHFRRTAEFIRRSFSAERIGPTERLVWAGDQTGCVLEMSAAVFEANLRVFFGFPQHSFVFPKDCAWCLSSTFGDDVYFGKRPVGFTPRKRKRR